MTAHSQQVDDDRREITAALRRLRIGLHRVQTTSDRPAADAEKLANLERQLIALAHRLDDEHGQISIAADEPAENAAQPESGTPWAAAWLAQAARWLRLLRDLDLDEPARTVAGVVDRLRVDAATAWCNSVESMLETPTTDSCFVALLEVTTLVFELGDGNPDEEGQVDRILETARRRLQEILVSCLETAAPDEATRRRWATALADRANNVLTSIDDVAPRQAAAWLAAAAADLDWHLRTVECSSGPLRRMLDRRRRRLFAEQTERGLQQRLERRFGWRLVARFERLILFLIVFVVALLIAEASYAFTPQTVRWLIWADACACAVFLFEFAVKWWFAPARWNWFRRHLLIDLVPSIPYGLLAGGATDPVRAARLARFLRLPRLARYLRLARPAVRALRVFGFLARGLDRVVRRLGPLLNRNVVLYPTRAERKRSLVERDDPRRAAARLHAALESRWRQLLLGTAPSQQAEVAAVRDQVFAAAQQAGVAQRAVARTRLGGAREITAELLLRRLAATSPHEVEIELGGELTTRLAKVVRAISRPPLAWLPMLHRLAPALGIRMTDAEVVSAGARSLATAVKRSHDQWFWLADLHGTVTPSQFVDRVGTMLVKSSFRPAYRLALFGGVFLLCDLLLRFTRFWPLQLVQQFINQFVAPALLLMGGICFVILGIGLWFRRIAREATEFYERSAQAQYLSLTEIIRTRRLERDLKRLDERVLRHEWKLAGGDADGGKSLAVLVDRVRQAMSGGDQPESANAQEFPRQAIDCEPEPVPCDHIVLERVVLMYRDALDGAMLIETDDRTTNQLLGNPALRQMVSLSGRVGSSEIRRLSSLDLQRQKRLVGGPYLWFNLIAKAVTHSVACLIVDYNRHVIPIEELPLVGEAERRRYDAWLGRGGEGEFKHASAADESEYLTTAFTALHFLDFDRHRDNEVERRFGEAVAERLRRDRSTLVRRIYGTYPLHDMPKERRVFNLFAIYETWLARGRALMLPWFFFLAGLRRLGRLLTSVLQAVREIWRPERRVVRADAADADFATAVRKIDRVRGPLVLACLSLRARFDPEYLGLALPGQPPPDARGGLVGEDLRYLEPEPAFVEKVALERRRAEADMRRLSRLLEGGLLYRAAERVGLAPEAFQSAEHQRAAAIIYLGDYAGVRRLASAVDILTEAYGQVEYEPLATPRPWPYPQLKRKFRRWWQLHGKPDRQVRRAAWRATRHNRWGVADCLSSWYSQGENAAALAEERLGELLRHPGRISEQLVTLRTVQTLAMLDVLHYREHIYRLGEYEQLGDEAGPLLEWPGVEDDAALNVADGSMSD